MLFVCVLACLRARLRVRTRFRYRPDSLLQMSTMFAALHRVRYTYSSTVRCVRVYMCETLRCVMCVCDEYDVCTSHCIRRARNVRLYDVSSVRCKRRLLTMATVLPTHEKLHSTPITALHSTAQHSTDSCTALHSTTPTTAQLSTD